MARIDYAEALLKLLVLLLFFGSMLYAYQMKIFFGGLDFYLAFPLVGALAAFVLWFKVVASNKPFLPKIIVVLGTMLLLFRLFPTLSSILWGSQLAASGDAAPDTTFLSLWVLAYLVGFGALYVYWKRSKAK